MDKYGKKRNYGILAGIAAFMLLSGCSGSKIQETMPKMSKWHRK